MTNSETLALAHEALDAAARLIQDRLGVKAGDLAGIVFSDGIVLNGLQRYIESEIAEMEGR